MHLIDLQLLFLILVTNGAPVLLAAALGRRTPPVDGGLCWRDGRPLLGPSKTWRGLLGAVSAATILAWLLGLPPLVGLVVGVFAMLGDLLSSFCKRRLGLVSSSQALGLDQIPECLLPLLAVRQYYDLSAFTLLELVVAFILLELILSRILYRLKIRHRPY